MRMLGAKRPRHAKKGSQSRHSRSQEGPHSAPPVPGKWDMLQANDHTLKCAPTWARALQAVGAAWWLRWRFQSRRPCWCASRWAQTRPGGHRWDLLLDSGRAADERAAVVQPCRLCCDLLGHVNAAVRNRSSQDRTGVEHYLPEEWIGPNSLLPPWPLDVLKGVGVLLAPEGRELLPEHLVHALQQAQEGGRLDAGDR